MTMLDRHAFGYSGGAGGIEDVGEVGRRRPPGRRARRLRRNRLRLGIKLDDPRAVAGQPSAERRGGDQQWRAGVVQNERQTRGWVARVGRQIGAARLENAEQPHQQRRRALDAKPNHRLRTNPLRAQMVRQLIGPRLELPVAQPLVRKYNRNRIRPRRSLRRKQLRQRRRQNRTPRRVPILEQPPPLSRRQKLKPPNRHIRRRYRPLQNTKEPISQRLNAGPIEQVAGVFNHPADPGRRAVRATRERAADRTLAPGPDPGQQRGKASLQHHEQARPSPPRKPQKPSVQSPTQPQLNPTPAIARNRRTRTVKRKPDLLGKTR